MLKTYGIDNIIKIKSKPKFEFRQDYSQTLSDNMGNSGLCPLNIWLIVKNHKESFDIKIGQAWPKHNILLNDIKLDENKPYTFIIKTVKADSCDQYKLLTIYDEDVAIYKANGR